MGNFQKKLHRNQKFLVLTKKIRLLSKKTTKIYLCPKKYLKLLKKEILINLKMKKTKILIIICYH